MRVLPEGRLVRVEFEMRLPASATPDEVEQWVLFNLGHGSFPIDHPLSDHQPEPFSGGVMLTDTRMNGRRIEYDHVIEGNTTRYKVRYERTHDSTPSNRE